MAQPNQALPIGMLLRGHYRLEKRLGAGGFGETYLAVDEHLPNHPRCVVKRFLPQAILAWSADQRGPYLAKAKEWFDREAHKLSELGEKSSEIPRLFAYFDEGDEFYLVMEFFDGQVLAKEIGKDKPWSEDKVVSFLLDTLSVLAIVHRAGVIHRDISPNNLMRLSNNRIALIDFGGVKDIRDFDPEAPALTTIFRGTPGYIAREQHYNRAFCASDIYAVGATALHAL